MPTIEVSRTLVKSPPELWSELQGERLREALGAGMVKPAEPDRVLEWESSDARGTATLEPSGWGTKVTLRAEVEERVAELEEAAARAGLWARLRRSRPELPEAPPAPDPGEDMALRLEQLLHDLGSAHRKPFQGS